MKNNFYILLISILYLIFVIVIFYFIYYIFTNFSDYIFTTIHCDSYTSLKGAPLYVYKHTQSLIHVSNNYNITSQNDFLNYFNLSNSICELRAGQIQGMYQYYFWVDPDQYLIIDPKLVDSQIIIMGHLKEIIAFATNTNW